VLTTTAYYEEKSKNWVTWPTFKILRLPQFLRPEYQTKIELYTIWCPVGAQCVLCRKS